MKKTIEIDENTLYVIKELRAERKRHDELLLNCGRFQKACHRKTGY